MRGLLNQLSELNADAGAAVGWIASFDQLIARHADFTEITRSTAGLASCVAGFSDHVHGVEICVGPDGRDVDGLRFSERATSRALVNNDENTSVWLARTNGQNPLDELITERMAIAIGLTFDRIYKPNSILTDSVALAELLDCGRSEVDRLWSGRILGFDGDVLVRVLAIRTGLMTSDSARSNIDSYIQIIQSHGEIARAASIGGMLAVATTCLEPETDLSSEMFAGVGSVVRIAQAANSWHEAVSAIRFTRPMPGMATDNFVRFEDLGVFGALSQIPIDAIRIVTEVGLLDKLSCTQSGINLIQALDSYVRMGSMRGAASELFLHHTSVAARIEQVGEALGFAVSTSEGALRAKLALAYWQLAQV
jgi:hypothetical protein